MINSWLDCITEKMQHILSSKILNEKEIYIVEKNITTI